MADYDILGNIAIIKGEKKSSKEKKKDALELMKRESIKTVVEKASDVHGRLRTIKTKHVLGEKNLIADFKENACRFEFNVETCYFSPRLSNERKVIAEKIKEKDNVLVMFAGVGVYPIVIYKYSRPKKIVGVELGRDCCKFFEKNLLLNHVPDGKIEIIQGDVKRKVNDSLGKFDVVVMARPNLKESFLKWGLLASKKGTRIFYYGFCKDEDVDFMVKELVDEAGDLNRKIKIKEIVPSGDIPHINIDSGSSSE